MMIGRPLQTAFPTITEGAPGDTVLTVSQLIGRRFGPVDLELHRGEIVGIAGAEGNGQVQFLRALAGVEPSHGTVICAGRWVHLTSPPRAIRAGIILLSADRKRESIFTALSVRANATLQVLRKYATLGFVRRKRERGPVNVLVDRLAPQGGLDRATDAVPLRRQPAEGGADAAVPAQRPEGDPR